MESPTPNGPKPGGQWAYGQPVDVNPLFDETGANAAVGQSGPVWFLAGVFNVSGTAHRAISVPKGTALFLPIINVEWDNLCPPANLTLDELRAMAAGAADLGTDLICEVDGVSVPDLSRFRVQAGPFSVTFPDNNVFQLFGCTDVVAGTYGPFVGDGYYVMLDPLSRGHHTVHFSGTFGPPVSFTLDIVYDVTVTDTKTTSTASLSPLSKAALMHALQTMRTAPVGASRPIGETSTAPNPVHDGGLLHFTLARSGAVDARLFDVNGRLARVIADRAWFSAGSHDLRVDRQAGDPLVPGVYFYRITTPEGASEGRMIVLR